MHFIWNKILVANYVENWLKKSVKMVGGWATSHWIRKMSRCRLWKEEKKRVKWEHIDCIQIVGWTLTRKMPILNRMMNLSKRKKVVADLLDFWESPKEISEKESPKDITNSSQNVTISGESSSSQIVFSQPTKKTSVWFDKTHSQNILTIEDGFYHTDPFQTLTKFFPKSWFFKPWDLTKPQPYYQSILEATESIKFKHFYLSDSHSESAYSTATILKVLSPKQWGDLFDNQKRFPSNFQMHLPHCLTYSYWDYQQAWYNTFFIQNPKKAYSWLFFFNSKIIVQSLTNWFQIWWNYFGPCTDILTPNAINCLNLFKAYYIPSESEKRFPHFLCFCTNFFLSWVWMWNLRYHTHDAQLILQRTFKVKWWSKFDEQSKLTDTLVRNWLSAKGFLEPTIQHSKVQQTFLTQKSKTQSLLASAKTEKEYFKVMQQFLATRSETSVVSSSSSTSADEQPFISLGDENEDDCFGIFSPLMHSKLLLY